MPESVEETPGLGRPIKGVDTATAAFVGASHEGPVDRSIGVSSLAEFERTYGGGEPLTFGRRQVHNYLWHAARAFFEQGGRRLFVQRVACAHGKPPDATAYAAALARLAEVDVALVAAPAAPAAAALVEHAERLRYRFALLDSGEGQSVEQASALGGPVDSAYAALAYPWLRVDDPITGGEIALPPSGFVAGLYARNDAAHGVQHAPANDPVLGATPTVRLGPRDLESLAQRAINPFRTLPSGQTVLWGARTTSADPEWKYVSVRRYLIYLEHSIDQGTQWAVFEPNGEQLWAAVRSSVEDFLFDEFRRGALLGTTPDEAFFVRCDRTTMTQDDLDNGRLVCLVGVAVVKPAEFVIFRIGQWTADHGRPCPAG
jgi:Bacteriophage tail sheath protein